jgi:hypothetical protein
MKLLGVASGMFQFMASALANLRSQLVYDIERFASTYVEPLLVAIPANTPFRNVEVAHFYRVQIAASRPPLNHAASPVIAILAFGGRIASASHPANIATAVHSATSPPRRQSFRAG